MICDRGPSYDALELEDVAQQKCLSHPIRNAKAVEESKTGRARQFSKTLKELLQQALALSAKKNELDAADYKKQAGELRDELTLHLRDRALSDEDNQRLLDGIGAQHDRARVLSFLTGEGVEPTNNRAERDLRPAVIARKASHCSRNERGARAFEANGGGIFRGLSAVHRTPTQDEYIFAGRLRYLSGCAKRRREFVNA